MHTPLATPKALRLFIRIAPPPPPQLPSVEILSQNFGYEFFSVDDYRQINLAEKSVFLICGAGILGDEFVEKYICINSHPGYLPLVRGLDALKWAIYEGLPLGVTTHIMGKNVDAGLMIDRQIVDVYKNDTFADVALRSFNLECFMLVDALKTYKNANFTLEAKGVSRRRMPKILELNLLKKFEDYKTNAKF